MGDLAALIGKNESGKTALLQALVHLNKDQEVGELDLCDEMWQAFEAEPELRIVEGTFELSAEETAEIQESVAGSPAVKTLRIWRTRHGSLEYEFPDVVFADRLQLNEAKAKELKSETEALRLALEAAQQRADTAGPSPSIIDNPRVWVLLDTLTQPSSLGAQEVAKVVAELQDLLKGNGSPQQYLWVDSGSGRRPSV